MCAKERPHGSVRGAPGNRRPYRDSRAVVENGPDKLKLILQGSKHPPETEALRTGKEFPCPPGHFDGHLKFEEES